MALVAMGGCTSQKKKGDLSLLGKVYHNTTAKYNGYFNANEIMMESILTLDAQHQDNYNKVLVMYPYVAADNPQAIAGQMDEAAKKVSIVASLHPRSHWVDDCYLLLGQSQYLKKDYESAEATLRYTVEKYSPSKMAKARKKTASGKKEIAKEKEAVKKEKATTLKQKRKEADRKRKEALKAAKKKKKSNAKKKGSKKSAPRPKTGPKEAPEKEAEKTPAPPVPTTEFDDLPAGSPGMVRLSDSQAEAAKSDPDNYILKHRPAYQEAVLWLGRTLIERDKYEEANRWLTQLESNPKTHPDVRRDLAGVQAYYHMRRKDYTQAIVYLEKAIEDTKSRQEKSRYSYIAAQLYEKKGNPAAAYAAYERTVQFKPDFEMDFSARLRMTQNSYAAGKGSMADTKRNLEKMLDEAKNMEYRDQIYFALAELAFRDDDRTEGMKNLNLSLQSSVNNRAQKAEAYYRLGMMYYEDEKFVQAKYYTDSTLQLLATNDERFAEVTNINKRLTPIVEQIEIVTLTDSLLTIGRMSDEEKRALAYERQKAADDARRQALLDAQNPEAGAAGRDSKFQQGLPSLSAAQGGRGSALTKESSFFAYNDRNLKRGKREFATKWNNRKLEDDWRRSSRRLSSDNNPDAPEQAVAAKPAAALTDEDMRRLLGNAPSSDNEIAEADQKVKQALYRLGIAYREQLQKYRFSADALEQLMSRYPEKNNYELEAWYTLYLDYADLNNPSKAGEYRQKILTKYSGTSHAKILKDPAYANNILDEERRQNMSYDEVYQAFKQGRYQEVHKQSEQMLRTLLGKHPLKPKYALLMAMCTGNLQGKDAYIAELQEVTARYPGTEEERRAKDMLRSLGIAAAKLPGNEKETDSSSEFVFKENDLHFMVIVFAPNTNLNDHKNKLADYNDQYHKLEKFRISNIYMGEKNEIPVLVLRRFKDKTDAMKYYGGVQKNMKDFINPSANYKLYPVSQDNYRVILKNKNTNGYEAFFEEYYK